MEDAALQAGCAAAPAGALYAAPTVRAAAWMGQVVVATIVAAHVRAAVREHAAPQVGYAATAGAAEQFCPKAIPVVRVGIEASSLQTIERAPVTR